MIGYLRGCVIHQDGPVVIMDCAGVGYEVFVGEHGTHVAPGHSQELAFWIHTHVREDQIRLFGFPDPKLRLLFKALLGVTGVGPKIAFALTADLGGPNLVSAIVNAHHTTLQSVSGVGKRMAERIALELKDKLNPSEWQTAPGFTLSTVWRDLHDALLTLGFPETSVRAAVNRLQSLPEHQSMDLESLIKIALQQLRPQH